MQNVKRSNNDLIIIIIIIYYTVDHISKCGVGGGGGVGSLREVHVVYMHIYIVYLH